MIYFVRHGETAQTRERRLQGRRDVPLNEKGEAQARAVGDWFRRQGIAFDLVYASPLGRAVETARLIAGDAAGICTDARLIEMDYGPYEGMDLTNPDPAVMAFFKDFAGTPAPEGMEQLSAVIARLGDFLEEHRQELSGRNVLISTHAIAMKGALEYLTPASNGAYGSKFVGNCAVYAAACENGVYSVPAALETGL